MLLSRPNRPLCPRCNSARVRPSAFKPGDIWSRLFLRQPVRCQSCFHRFSTWYQVKPEEEPVVVPSPATPSRTSRLKKKPDSSQSN